MGPSRSSASVGVSFNRGSQQLGVCGWIEGSVGVAFFGKLPILPFSVDLNAISSYSVICYIERYGTALVESTLPELVCQFSIFTENKVGRLADLTRLFGQREIHILALNTLDTTMAILRQSLTILTEFVKSGITRFFLRARCWLWKLRRA